MAFAGTAKHDGSNLLPAPASLSEAAAIGGEFSRSRVPPASTPDARNG